MRVVVLDADQLRVLLEGPLRRQVLGMEVVRDHFRLLDREHRQHEREIGAEGAIGRLRVEIAEMGREERLVATGDAEGRLQLGAHRDDRPGRGQRERDRRRCVAARAPDGKPGPDDRVLATAADRSIVGEHGIGDPVEPLPGVVVIERDRLVRAVAARQHDRLAELGAEQMVERRIGEHHPEPGPGGDDRWGDRSAGQPLQQHDRRSWRAEERKLLGRAHRDRLRRGAHHGEGLLLALLARTEQRDCALVTRKAREVVAADPLDGEHSPLTKNRNRLGERHRQLRPARRAARRLGVEPAVGRILVLARGTRRTSGSPSSSCSPGRTAQPGRS